MDNSLLGGLGVQTSQDNCRWPVLDAVNIFYQDKFRKLAVPPHFRVHLKNAVIGKGRYAYFHCVARGFPEPEFEWYKGTFCILRSSEIFDQDEGGKYRCTKSVTDGGISLMILNPCTSDLGPYACRIMNESGEAWSIAALETSVDDTFNKFDGKDKNTSKIQILETIKIKHSEPQMSVNIGREKSMFPNMCRSAISVAYASSKTLAPNSFTVSQIYQPKLISKIPGSPEVKPFNRTTSDDGAVELSGHEGVHESITAILLNETLEKTPNQGLMFDQNSEKESPPETQEDLGIASANLDGIIQKLVEFSNEECVIVSTLAIDKENSEAPGADIGVQRRLADEIVLDGTLDLSQKDPSLEEGDFYDISRKSQKPRFVLGLENMEIAAGSEVYLNVSVTGYPPPQLFWFKDGSPLNMNLAGIATDKLMHGQAIYTCIARNIAGEAVTSSTVFAVKESANNETPIPVEECIASKSQLEASSYCASSKVSSRSLVDYLRTKAKEMAAKRIYTREVMPAVLTGSILSLSSISTANFETAEEDLWSSDAHWDDNYTTVEEDFESSDCYLSSDLLTSFARDDPETRCPSANRLTLASTFSQERSVDLDERSEISTPVPMEAMPPSFLLSPKDFTFSLGSEFKILCSVDGDPHPKVSWYRDGVKIAEGTVILEAENHERFHINCDAELDRSIFGPRNYSFIVKASKIIDAGEYSVTAANHLGSVTVTCHGKEGSNETHGCSEFSQPVFVNCLQDFDGLEGKDASMIFCISGQPEPDVTVMHKNEEITGGKYLLEKLDGGRYNLTIKKLQLNDEGEIKISAVNVSGFCESTCEVFVDDAIAPMPADRSIFAEENYNTMFYPSTTNDHFPQESQPCFDEITEDVAATEGSEVTFTVAVYGWPTPEVIWKKNDEDITVDERIKMESKDYGVHSLLITKVEASDFGIYSCIAKNSVGEIACKAELAAVSGINLVDSTSMRKEHGNLLRFKDHFKVEKVIGNGSFSVVSFVKQLNDDVSKYAAKYILCQDPTKRTDYMNEVNLLRSLSHANIIAYKDVFVTKKQIILVMEYAHVEWFDFLLQERVCGEFEIARQVLQVCNGLEYMHKQNIVHLNIKPENIMTNESGKQMKIIDFGNAKQILDDNVVVDFGDPEFVAPEIVQGTSVLDSTDMWSLGITIYVALCGSSPFHGDSDFNTLERVKEGKIEFSKPFAKISTPATDFVKHLLIADKSSRMQSREAVGHEWLKGNFDFSGDLSSSRLKYFCSRRRWQRSLIGPRTSLAYRSISSLLKKEFDSTSIIVPKEVIGNYMSSSTVTESDSESPSQQAHISYTVLSVDSYEDLEYEEQPEGLPCYNPNNDCAAKQTGAVLGSVISPIDSKAADPRFSEIILETPKITMKMLGKKVSFEGGSPSEIRDRCLKGGAEDDIIMEKKEVGSYSNDGKRSLRKKSLAKTRRQSSMSKQLDWSSSESDDTIHSGDRMTLSPLNRASFTCKSMDVSDRKHMRGILKSGSSTNTNAISPKSPRYRAVSPRNRESTKSRVKQLVRGTSLNIENVPKLYVTSEDAQGRCVTTNAAKRRADMRRGSSVESVLSKKLNSRLVGLRGPLLEKNRPDEPTAGMTLRSSQPVMMRGGSLTLSVESSNPNTPTLDVPFRDHFFGTARSDELVRLSNEFRRADHKRSSSVSSRSLSSIRNEQTRTRSPFKWQAADCYAPFFKSKLMNQGLSSKQISATLLCLVDANPPPEVTWFKDGEEINNSDQFDVISEPSIFRYQLKIRSLKLPTDFGQYSFKAHNNYGEIESSCTLSAAVVPEKMQRPSVVVNHTDRSVWVEWRQPSNCPDHPIHYRLEYREHGNLAWAVIDNLIRERTYSFHNLKRNSSYRFRVRAENNAGIGMYSRASQRLTLLE